MVLVVDWCASHNRACRCSWVGVRAGARTNKQMRITTCKQREQVTACGCRLDGSDGAGCNNKTESVCPNQCSGRGSCRLGFCRCDAGWWGMDCAHAATSSAAAAPRARLHPYLEGLAIDAWSCSSTGDGCSTSHMQRQDDEWAAEMDESHPSDGASDGTGLWRRQPPSRRRGVRQDEGDDSSSGQHEDSSNQQSTTSSSSSSSQQGPGSSQPPPSSPPGRLRPLIYVYDVPAAYVSRMLSYRLLKDSCSWRWFYSDNSTVVGFFTYGGAFGF